MKPILTIIPCLNEAAVIEPLIDYLLRESTQCPMHIVIADGGSTDGTVEIIARLAAAHPTITALANPKRIQSAAMNRAVAAYGDAADYLVRIDAHADYPAGFFQALLEDAQAQATDAVVVTMHTVGNAGFQRGVAAAQNSKLGNGGASHRHANGQGHFVDHGHHALMRIAAFRAVGGYDEYFSHNEDAELDIRLRKAGFRLWLTDKTSIDYHPRRTARALFAQYLHYGRGRARTLLKHHVRPRLRQMLPVGVAPAIVLALLAPVWGGCAVPMGAWMGICLVYGGILSANARDADVLWAGPAAILMHAGWSIGFWQTLIGRRA